MNNLFSSRLIATAGIVLGAVAVLPLLILSAYNHPSAADDYCFADTTTRFGFWQAQQFYYDGWSGRYFANFLVHANPLVLGWYDGFRLVPAMSVLGLLTGMALFVNELLRQQSVWVRAGVTGTLFFLYVLALRSVAEAFFWMPAIPSYTVPMALTMTLLTVIIRWYRLPGGWLKSLTTVWAGFLVFATVGSSETNMVLLILLLAVFFVYNLLFNRQLDIFLLGLIGVSLLSAWLMFHAPGNAVRIGGNPNSRNLVGSVLSAAQWLLQTVPDWFLKTPVLILSVVYVPFGLHLVRPNAPTQPLFTAPAWFVTLAYAGLLMAMIFPSYYGIGIAPVYRVINITYLVFLLGWFYTLTVWLQSGPVRWLARDQHPSVALIKKPVTVGLWLIAMVWIGGSVQGSVALKTVYTDLLRGKAAIYDHEMTDRHRLLMAAGSDTLRLRPISVYPQSLFMEDVREDPAFLWNRCQAGFYHHRAILLDTTTLARSR